MAARKNAAADEPTQKEIYKAYFDLHAALRNAYWYTPDEDTGDRIAALADACFEILTELNREDIRERTGEFEAIRKKVMATNERLEKAKQEIDNIIRGVEIAGRVLEGIEQVAGMAAGFA